MLNVRVGAFETNSSSVHALVMCTDEEYKKFQSGKLYVICDNKGQYRLATKEDVVEEFIECVNPPETFDELMEMCDDEFDTLLADKYIAYSYDNFGEDYEDFTERYTTPGGEEIVAFGYYGHD